MSPKFSIIIPAYNVAPYLRESLDSVLAQTHTNWEAICVDDGSSDGSGEILDEYAARDPRFKIVHQINEGVARAREVGLSAANGEWICWIDADDKVDPEFLVGFNSVIYRCCVDMIWADYRVDDRVLKTSYIHSESREEDLHAFAIGVLNGDHFGSLWNKAFRRLFILENNIEFPKARIPVCEDLWFLMSFLSRAPKIHHADRIAYHYINRYGSALSSPYTYERFKGFVRVQEYLERLSFPSGADQILLRRRKEIKAAAYRNVVVPDSDFYSLYPEIRDLRGFDCPIWHKVLFWFAVRGFRSVINIIWRIIDK